MSCLKLSKPRNLKSQTLIEIVISIALAAMVISALLVLGAASSKTVSASLKRSQATKLAVAGLEAVRYMRDQEGFIDLKDGDYVISGATLTTPSGCALSFCPINLQEKNALGADTTTNTFERKIIISSTSSSEFEDYLKRVDVSVRWKSGGASDFQEVTVSTILSIWNK